jgi:hypothetical protein
MPILPPLGVITLQDGDTLNVYFLNGLYQCIVGNVTYQANTKAQLLLSVQNVYPITDHTLIDQHLYDVVFYPKTYPLS